MDGDFLLRSGLHSRQYFQCALVLQYPNIAERLCSALAVKLKDVGAQTVISPALGGLFIGHEVGRALGRRHIFVEKMRAVSSTATQFQDRAARESSVVEDVITKGGRVRRQSTSSPARWRGGRSRRIGGSSGGKVDFGVRLEIC